MSRDFTFYQVRLCSHLGSAWVASLPIVDFETTLDARHQPITALTVRVVDQAELIGVLNDLHGHGLKLLSLDFVDTPGTEPAARQAG